MIVFNVFKVEILSCLDPRKKTPIEINLIWHLSKLHISSFFPRIEDLRKRDLEKRQLEAAKNDLEAYIIEGQDRLYRETYEAASTEEQRTEMREQLSAASDWLYEQEEATDKKVASFIVLSFIQGS